MGRPGENIKVVVAGGGFAGLGFLESIRARCPGISLTLVDPSPNSVFRPLLPDAVAGRVGLESCCYSLPEFCRSRRVRFLAQAADGLAGEKKLILNDGTAIEFDYLIVACGATPEHHGNTDARKHALALYSEHDAARLIERVEAVLEGERETSLVVVGGGYTGLEAATALKYRIRRKIGPEGARRFPIKVVELAPRILAGLPEEIAGPARREVRRLGIEVITSAELGGIGPEGIEVNGDYLSPAITVWSAGVSGAEFVRNLPFEQDGKGRIGVNDRLHPPERGDIFVLGDCASFAHDGTPLRMAIQFSLSEGKSAAGNLAGRLGGRPERPYRPRDLGYLIPLASGRAWGEVLGARVGGRLGSFLHYFMCVYRSRGLDNRRQLAKDLVLGRNTQSGKSRHQVETAHC